MIAVDDFNNNSFNEYKENSDTVSSDNDNGIFGAYVWFQSITTNHNDVTESIIIRANSLVRFKSHKYKYVSTIKRHIKFYSITVKHQDRPSSVPLDLTTNELLNSLNDKEYVCKFREENRKNMDKIIKSCLRLSPENGKLIQQLLTGK